MLNLPNFTCTHYLKNHIRVCKLQQCVHKVFYCPSLIQHASEPVQTAAKTAWMPLKCLPHTERRFTCWQTPAVYVLGLTFQTGNSHCWSSERTPVLGGSSLQSAQCSAALLPLQACPTGQPFDLSNRSASNREPTSSTHEENATIAWLLHIHQNDCGQSKEHAAGYRKRICTFV